MSSGVRWAARPAGGAAAAGAAKVRGRAARAVIAGESQTEPTMPGQHASPLTPEPIFKN